MTYFIWNQSECKQICLASITCCCFARSLSPLLFCAHSLPSLPVTPVDIMGSDFKPE